MGNLLKAYMKALKTPNKKVFVILTEKEKRELLEIFNELF
jgi:hypothetical protein